MKKILSFGLAVVALFAFTACMGFNEVAASVIAIDVNPSVVLELDEDDKVINVILDNEDAEIILGDMDLIGVDYNVAINAIIGSMVANGYLDELANSVLLSISSNDEVREGELMAELSQVVNAVLESNQIDGSVITQDLEFEQDAEDLAELLGISEAKAELILDIIEVDPRLTVEELALLSINDLNLLLQAKNISLDDVEKIGSASELGIITVEEAYQVALLELGIDESLVVELEIELEQEDGVMVYEVELKTDTEEYEILINAKEGTVYVEQEDDDDEDEIFPEDALPETEVLSIIATELQLDESFITELEIEAEMENGIAYYEVEFEYENMEYELEVNALDGEIYTNSMDEDGFDYDDDFPTDALNPEAILAMIILERDLDESEITKIDFEQEEEDGVYFYEIEFEYRDVKYELEVNAITGEVYYNSMDNAESFPVDAMTESEILAMILIELNLDEQLVIEVDFEKEIEEGLYYYEIQFKYGDFTFELEVDAMTGEIYYNSMA